MKTKTLQKALIVVFAFIVLIFISNIESEYYRKTGFVETPNASNEVVVEEKSLDEMFKEPFLASEASPSDTVRVLQVRGMFASALCHGDKYTAEIFYDRDIYSDGMTRLWLEVLSAPPNMYEDFYESGEDTAKLFESTVFGEPSQWWCDKISDRTVYALRTDDLRISNTVYFVHTYGSDGSKGMEAFIDVCGSLYVWAIGTANNAPRQILSHFAIWKELGVYTGATEKSLWHEKRCE